tara:strand:- start:1331 stop:1567 length:237 start_codon:yes stop_codon:yes gene_type:complete
MQNIEEKELDNSKLEEAYDLLKYVDRSNSFVYIPTDIDDVKPFFLLQIKGVVDSLIKKAIADDPERATFYRLMEDDNA